MTCLVIEQMIGIEQIEYRANDLIDQMELANGHIANENRADVVAPFSSPHHLLSPSPLHSSHRSFTNPPSPHPLSTFSYTISIPTPSPLFSVFSLLDLHSSASSSMLGISPNVS